MAARVHKQEARGGTRQQSPEVSARASAPSRRGPGWGPVAVALRLKRAGQAWLADDANILAAAVAYYAALSFFPLVMVLISVLGLVLSLSSSAQSARQQLLETLANQTSPQLAAQIQQVFEKVELGAGRGGPLGLFTLLLTAGAVFVSLDTAFDRIWKIPSRGPRGPLAVIRGVLFDRFKAFLTMLSLGLLILVSFVATFALSTLRTFAPEVPSGATVWSAVHIMLGVVFNVLLFTALYKLLPKARVRWADALAGGVLAAIVWEIGRQVLSALIIGEKYTAYGVVGALIALMLWVYYGAAVLFLGAEFAEATAQERKELADRTH